MKQVVNSTLLTLLLLVPASVSAQSDVGVYVTGPDLQTKELEFKVVEGQKVKSGFQVKPESVVQVSQGGNLLVVTEPRNNVDNVKVTDGGGKITKLVNTNGDTFSLSGIAPGVYTLDVIANMPNSDARAAYETILVILSPGQSPQDPTQIIQKVKVITEIDIDFDDYDDGCSNKPGSAGLKFPQNKRTECEQRDYDYCKKNGFGSSGFCENIYELFWDDDCFGYNSLRECNQGYNDPEPILDCFDENGWIPCPEDKPIPPPCGEGRDPITGLCRDVIDDCTDESGCTPTPVPGCPPSCPNDEDLPTPPPIDPCIENPGSLGCPRIPIDPVIEDPNAPPPVLEEPIEDDNEDSNGSNGNENSGGEGSGGDGSNGDSNDGGNGDSNGGNGEVFE